MGKWPWMCHQVYTVSPAYTSAPPTHLLSIISPVSIALKNGHLRHRICDIPRHITGGKDLLRNRSGYYRGRGWSEYGM